MYKEVVNIYIYYFFHNSTRYVKQQEKIPIRKMWDPILKNHRNLL